MVNVNDYISLTDSETFEKAIADKGSDGIIIVPPRKSEIEPERDFWLIDRAILLPENTTIIMQNCTIKLSDKCRDNFFRTSNCGIGIAFPERISNVYIRGEGLCVLQGADYPRATGDSSKLQHSPCPYLPEDICRVADWVPEDRRTLEGITFLDVHEHSYGTDAGKDGESQYGDWRGIGILFANVENFSISNLRIVKSHGWGISMEECAKGYVEKIDFDSCMYKEIDGMLMNMENQDGIDVRNGCHHIVISDITGHTGDDVVALTAIADTDYKPGGSFNTTHVMHNDWTKRDRDIHDIIIKNVIAHSHLCFTVRLLAAMAKVYNVTIDGIIDTAPDCKATSGTLLLGDGGNYGEEFPDSIRNITVSNMICHSSEAISVRGYVTDAVISNVVNRNPECEVITVHMENALKNVATNNLVTTYKQ